MHKINITRTERTSRLTCGAILLLTLLGCSSDDGGLVGTGTGPTTDTYELKHLPKRISPDLPESILKGDEVTPLQPASPDTNKVVGNDFRGLERMLDDKAQGWEAINFELNLVNYMRMAAEVNTTLVDLAFDDIRLECAQQPIDCVVPSDTLRVAMTPAVVNRLIQLHSEWALSLGQFMIADGDTNDLIRTINETFTPMVGSEITLGETRYSQLQGAPYDHAVVTTLLRGSQPTRIFPFVRWRTENFHVQWRDDGQAVKFITTAENTPTEEYFYENNAPGELVTTNLLFDSLPSSTAATLDGLHAKVFGSDPQNSGVLIEVVSTSEVIGSSTVDDPAALVTTNSNPTPISNASTNPNSGSFVVGQSYGLFQGQLDNEGGYSIYTDHLFDSMSFDKLEELITVRESFDNIGTLLAGEQCFLSVTETNATCGDADFQTYGPDGNATTDSINYFPPNGFDALSAVEDNIRWQVQNLPLTNKRIAVVSAVSTHDIAMRELLCRGFQFVPGDVKLFCTASDEQLESALIVELVDGVPTREIMDASLVQVQ